MVCNNCGNQNADNAANCAFCGAPFAPAQAAPQQPPMGQPMYQQPPMGQPMYQQPIQAPVVPGKGLGIAGMVLGIIALALFCVWYLALPCAIVAVILSGLGFKKAKDAGMKNGMAVAGIVCSSIALGVAIIFTIIGIIGAMAISETLSYGMY